MSFIATNNPLRTGQYRPPAGRQIPGIVPPINAKTRPAGQQMPPFANMPDQYAPPGGSEYWRPSALRSEPAPAAGGRQMSVSTEGSTYRNPHQGSFSFTYSPLATGAGGYFPGHHAQDANNANYAAQEAYRSWATGKVGVPKTWGEAVATSTFGGGRGGGNLGGAWQDALNSANAANEQRYLEGLSGYQNRYERNMDRLKGAGEQEASDINQRYDNQGASINQDLVSRGLRNSSLAGVMAMGNNRERTEDLGRLNERLRQQEITTDAGLSGDLLQFLERRTDSGPDMGMLAQLAQGVGAAGGGAALPPVYMSPGEIGFVNPMAMFGGGGGWMAPLNGSQGGYGRNPAEAANAAARRAAEVARRNRGGGAVPAANDFTGYVSPEQMAYAGGLV